MNILDFEEMSQVQKMLLSIECNEVYQLLGADSATLQHLSNFTSSLFTPADASLQQQINKSIKNTQNIKQIKADSPSSMLRIFTYAVVSIILPPSKDSRNQERTGNQLLLETLKCSLFSKDVDFTHVWNSHFQADNLQGKAMIARFFNFLTSSARPSNFQKIKYAEWALENHPVLLQLFTIFLRIILDKLDIEGARDCDNPLDYDETLTNLIEFFDVNYRNHGSLFLFPEENYFLASVEGSLVFGEYFENERNQQKKENQLLKPVEIEKGSSEIGKMEHRESLRKNGVIEGDMKMFNFLLESGMSSNYDKDRDLETPHFQSINQFAFGRKKKQEDQIVRQEYFKKEFQKILLNSDTESVRELEMHAISQNDDTPKTPAAQTKRQKKSNEKHENASDNAQEKQFILRKDTFNQNPNLDIDEECYDNQRINPQQGRNTKNIVSVKDKHFTTFSPPAPKNGTFEHFSSFVNDANFLEPDSNNDYLKSSYEKMEDMNQHRFGNCFCTQLKKKKSELASKVVDFMFIPSRFRNNGCRSPKFLNNLKHSQNITYNPPKIKITPPKETKNGGDVGSLTIKQNRTPNFIKGLRKDKDKTDKYSASSKSKEKASVKDKSPSSNHPKNVTRLDLDKQSSRKASNRFTKFSTILTKNPQETKPKESKSTTRKNDSSSLSKHLPTEQVGIIKRFDSQFFNTRPGLGNNNWKSTSSFHPPQGPNMQKKQPIQYEENNQKDKRGITRIYAPVHIIAPTVYFNGGNQKDNKVIFHVNDGYEQQERSKEMRDRDYRMYAKSEEIRFAEFRKQS